MSQTTRTLGGGAGNKTRTAAPGRLTLACYKQFGHLKWGDMMTGYAPSTSVVRVETPVTALERDFALWKDMVENPCQYGDDIVEWLDLNEQLLKTRKSWKIERYWRARDEEKARKESALQAEWRSVFSPIAKEAATLGARRWVQRDIQACLRRFRTAATTIQAAVRGHQARSKQTFRDCCMCLSHRISPLKTDVGHMCRGCAEQGPYEDATGPLSDPWNWFRADYVDLVC